MNNLNHTEYLIMWRELKSGDLRIEEHECLIEAVRRKWSLLKASRVNPKTVTLYQQAYVSKGEQITRIIRFF